MSMSGAATTPACPRTPRRRPAPQRLRSERTPPSQTVTWTRLLNFTAGRRTHTMARAHSELGTGHCGRRIGTKISQDGSCSPSTRPAERQVRGLVLSKEQGSLPPSAGNTAAPSRFGELLARALSASFLCRLGIPADVLALKFVLQFWKAFKRSFPKIEPPAHHICAGKFSRLSRQCTPYVRACREPLPLPVSQSMRAIPECPNDAFQCLMSCAQATARRDAERARIRSAVTRTARA